MLKQGKQEVLSRAPCLFVLRSVPQTPSRVAAAALADGLTARWQGGLSYAAIYYDMIRYDII